MINFKHKIHKKYLSMIVSFSLPHNSSDSSRITLAYFALSGLDILNGLDTLEEKRKGYIDWLYYLQSSVENVSGFQNGATFNNDPVYKCGHIAATYSALNALLILGDDLSCVNKSALLQSLRLLQLADGSFCAAKYGTENDMRFVYCAASICYILNDWSGMDVEKTVQFILDSICYDGGIAQGPHMESHGGSTYCGVATLALANQLHRVTNEQKHRLVRWIINRQRDGFEGRPNKKVDTCYTFWLGATLKILNAYDFIDAEALENFVLSTQDFQTGGFSKWIGYGSDPLHTYFSLAGLSLMKSLDLAEIVPSLNITYKTYEHLKKLHKQWETQ